MSSNNYRQLKSQLDEIILRLEADSLDIDEALKLYEKSQKILAEMEMYLKKTEVKIKKLK